MAKLKYLSLFSGIGGFEYGLEQSEYEFEFVGFSEIDKYAKSIYLGHFPRHKDLGDASEIDPKQLQDFDLLVGGFPCQAFSLSGKRMGFDDTRGTLFFEIARICAEKKPRYLLLENVKGLLSHDGGRTYKKMLGVLAELGYDVEWSIYNSKDYGTAQNRERLYIKGYFRAKCGGEILSQKRDSRKASVQGIKKLIRNKQASSIYSTDGTSVTLTGCGGGWGGKTGLYAEPSLKTHHFQRQVKKRVHSVDTKELSLFLKKYKDNSGLSYSIIADELGKPLSMVEHWFRTDDYFAPPSDDVWLQLKEMLGIESDEYDDYMLEFEWVDGVFEQDKRASDVNGLSSTLTTKNESLIVDPEVKVLGTTSPTGHWGKRVYDKNGLSPTLCSQSLHKNGLRVMLDEDNDPKIKIVGNVSNTGHNGENVLDKNGLASTITACNYKHPIKIIESNLPRIKLKTNTTKGYDEVTAGDGVRLCHPTSTKARGRSQKGQTGALSTGADWGTVERDYRIRKLTPRECERLQAFPDDWTLYGKDGEIISDTQRYKCLGNAVTTSVVTHIANEMFRGYFEE